MPVTKTQPLVSVFIPTYNAEVFVRQSIESVLAQTYPNYELVIIDDASTDQTREIVKQYKEDPRVRIYYNTINLGVAGNWNRGVALCRGELIVRLDADDFYNPFYLEKVVHCFQQHPELDMVFTGVELLDQNGKITLLLPYKDSWVSSGHDFLPDLLRICHVRSPTACVKQSCYQRLGPIINEMAIHEDWEMWIRIAATGCIGYIAEPLATIRILSTNGCTSKAIKNALSPIACNIWLEYLDKQKLPYQLSFEEIIYLKQGMYNQIMAFAVMAMESELPESVEKHLAFARTILPPGSRGSMQARLYARAAEIYFMHGGHHRKGWQFLLKSLRLGLLSVEQNRRLKLWARAIFGKNIFEFVRKHTIVRWKFPYVRNHQV